jgi:tripartite-type tricarboxylate transporter receptor subunit TctC
MELKALRRVAVACLVSLFASLLLHPGAGWGQSFPSEPIKIIVPFAPGGNTDVTARLVAPIMQQILGQSVIIENRAGAGGMIGAGGAIGSKPDGHTLMMGTNSTLSVGPNVYPNWPYDPIKGITPIIMIQTVPFALVVKADSPIKSVQDLVKLAKEKPGEITVAHAGTGSSNHLVAELFQIRTGTKLLLVPYKGAAPAMNDVLAGQVQTIFDQASTTVPQVQGGTVRAIAITSAKRMPPLPDTPTFAEAGVKDFEVLNVTGFVGPPGMDPKVVDKLRDATLKALADPKVKEGFAKIGVDVVGSSAQEFAAFIKQDLELWARVIKDGNVKVK